MGDMCAEPECMEEDFLLLEHDENDLFFNLDIATKEGTLAHIPNQNEQVLHMFGEMQAQQGELKKII